MRRVLVVKYSFYYGCMKHITTSSLVLFLLTSFALNVSVRRATALEPRCAEVCIVELQTRGTAEADDAVVIANQSTADIPPGELKLQYYTASSNLGGSQIVTVAIPAQSSIKLVSGSLTQFNATSLQLSLGLYSKGGSIKVLKSTRVMDEVKWGTLSLVAHSAGEYYLRTLEGFSISKAGCDQMRLSEVQPFSINSTGADIVPWIELESIAPVNVASLCLFEVNASKIELSTGVSTFTTFDVNQKIETLASIKSSTHGLVFSINQVPLGDLIVGQTYAFNDGRYNKTWLSTKGAQNIVQTNEATNIVALDCLAMRMSRLMINSLGSDKTKEWLELVNTSGVIQNLSSCELKIDGKVYGLPDMSLTAGEHQLVYKLKNSDDDLVDIVFVNSNIHEISLLDSASKLSIQTVQYQDAPEGKVLARSLGGEWKWSDVTGTETVSGSGENPEPIQKNTEIAPLYSGSGEASPIQKTVTAANTLLKSVKSKINDAVKSAPKSSVPQKAKIVASSTSPVVKPSKSPSASTSKKQFSAVTPTEDSSGSSPVMVAALQICIAAVVAIGIFYTLYGYKNTIIAYFKKRKVDAAAR
jgi:hypothetical protein